MVPPGQGLKADNPPRFQIDDRLIIRLNLIPSDGRSQVPFQKRSLTDVCIHLRIEKAVPGPRISGARKCNVGAPEELIDSYLPAASLRDPHIRTDAELL